jgi:release factor glutamine methyltransferase
VDDAAVLLVSRLAAGGFLAAEDEADQLIACASGSPWLLESSVRRRLAGEPLSWITGTTTFCGVEVRVDPGVYEPRWQSEPLVRRALSRLPAEGVAVDLCTGSGAVAAVLAGGRPAATVVASDIDGTAVRCAAANGVDVFAGDLFAPLPPDLAGRVDVVVGIVPYVPTPELTLLPRDTLAFESARSYDGGRDGIDVLRRVVHDSPRYLVPGGAFLVELGGAQAELLAGDLAQSGFVEVATLADDDGDIRGIEATWTPGAR